MQNHKYKLGVIGCGNISSQYFETFAQCPNLEVIACASRNIANARTAAQKYSIPKVLSPDAIINYRDIDIVANLTTPDVHFEIALAAIIAGKHIYNEKPLTLNLEQAKELMKAAEQKGVRIGSAPDTFLGTGIQTCRDVIDKGVIGETLNALALFLCPGPELWHPNPEFYYKPGGGPLFDIGPYYLTALVYLLGPVKSVTGKTSTAFAERTITSLPKNSQKIKVEVPTHAEAILTFSCDVTCSMVMSFDSPASVKTSLEITGDKGTLIVPSPIGFEGPVTVNILEKNIEHELRFDLPGFDRGLGIAEMAWAMDNNKPHLANGQLATHIVDIMQAVHESSDSGKRIELTTTCDKPEVLDESFINMLLKKK